MAEKRFRSCRHNVRSPGKRIRAGSRGLIEPPHRLGVGGRKGRSSRASHRHATPGAACSQSITTPLVRPSTWANSPPLPTAQSRGRERSRPLCDVEITPTSGHEVGWVGDWRGDTVVVPDRTILCSGHAGHADGVPRVHDPPASSVDLNPQHGQQPLKPEQPRGALLELTGPPRTFRP